MCPGDYRLRRTRAHHDSLYGQSGRDRLAGGPGKDRLLGNQGRDRIVAADGERDRISCGGGSRDSARVDKRDRVRGCERVRRR